jgi:hypothetical protein
VRDTRRPLATTAALVALVALVLALSRGSALTAPSSIAPQPARAVASADHVAFVGVIDSRTSAGFANLIGLSSASVVLLAGWSWSARRIQPQPGRAAHGLRRWRARLEGAPPVVS